MKILLKIILTISLVTLTISIITQNVVVTTLKNEIVAKKINSLILDKTINDIDTDKLGLLEKAIVKSGYIEKITQKYIDNEINNIINNTNNKIDTTDDINNMLDEYLTGLVPSQSKEEVKEYVNEKVLTIRDNIQSASDNTFNEKYKPVLQIYNILTSKILKTVTIILSILSTFILVILEKKKVVKTLSHISLILSLTSLIMYITISLATNYIDQNIMGGLLNQISTSLPLKLFIIFLIASIILQVLNKTILKEN